MAREIVRTLNLGKRNLLINGDMSLAQRGGSIQALTTLAAGEYYLDRWKCAATAVSVPQIAQSSLPAGFPGNSEIDRALRMVGTAVNASTSVYGEQRIESIRLLGLNETNVSVGFWIWVSNFTNIRVQVSTANALDNFNGGVTPIVDIDIPVDADSSWQYVEVKDVEIPNKNGVVVTYYANTPSNTSGSFDTYMTQIMVNDGPTVQPFRLMAEDRDAELFLAKRYYEFGEMRARAALTSGSIEFHGKLVHKRTFPTMTTSVGSLVAIDSNSFSIGSTSASFTANWTADAEL